jgi:hypothetical protein
MDAITLVAQARSTSEERVVNDMTYRQLLHSSTLILRDRMFVVTTLADVVRSAFAPMFAKAKAGKGAAPAKGRGLPGWFKRRSGRRVAGVVDLDGPIEQLRGVASGEVFGDRGPQRTKIGGPKPPPAAKPPRKRGR